MPVRHDFAPGEFCWVDLSAHDLESAAAWYGGLFDWSVHHMEPHDGAPSYAFFMRGEAGVGGIGQMEDAMRAQGIPPTWNSYVATKDVAALEARVPGLGGQVIVPTTEVPGHGKLAYFLDPEGACIAAWQSTSSGGPGLLWGEPGGACWNELMTRDTARARAFYGELHGWEFADMPMEGIAYTLIRHGGEDAGGMMPIDGPEHEGTPPHWLVYFAVADCRATAARAAETGGQVRVPPTRIPVGTFSILGDPQGGGFGIITPADASG